MNKLPGHNSQYWRYNWRKAELILPHETSLGGGRRILPIGTQIEIAVIDCPPEMDAIDDDEFPGWSPYIMYYSEGNASVIGVIQANEFREIR